MQAALKLATFLKTDTFWVWVLHVGINNPLVLKTDTRETENLEKAISVGQEGTNMCSLPLSKHISTKWLTVAPPYIPDAIVPAPHLGFVRVKGSQSFPTG
jgi:hypothetical protein